MTAFDHRLALRVLAVTFGSVATAAAGGIALGLLIYQQVLSGSSPDDPWAELGAGLLAGGIGLVVGGAVFVVAATAGVCWAVPAGRRGRTIAAVLAAPVVMSVFSGAVGTAAGGGLPGWLVPVWTLALLGAVVAVVLFAAGALRPGPGGPPSS